MSKVYALTIPTQEFFDFWMKNDHASTVFHRIDMIGVNLDLIHDCQHLLFRTKEDRREAYQMIKDVYPETLCGFNVSICEIDEKYLKPRA